MSSSSPPICIPSPNFSFPFGKPSDDYFNITPSDCRAPTGPVDPKPLLHPSSTASSISSTTSSYSAHRHNSNNSVSTTSSVASAKNDARLSLHKQFDSFSSMASDETMFDLLFSYRFKKSTDTLVDEPNSPVKPSKNHLNLKLNVPKHRYNQSLSASSTKTLSEIDEDGSPVAKASSAVEARFPKANDIPRPEIRPAKQPPTLVKHLTSPAIKLANELSFESIKQEQLKRLNYSPTPANYYDSIRHLAHVSYIDQNELRQLVDGFEPENLLIIDIRPFADFIKGHLKHAINVCLPLTLLKRQNFNLKRCINSLPQYEKSLFQAMGGSQSLGPQAEKSAGQSDQSSPQSESVRPRAVVVYENLASTAGLYHMCKKFVDDSYWAAQPAVYVLRDDFGAVAAASPAVIEAGHLDSSPASPAAPPDPPHLSSKFRSVSLSDVPTSTPEFAPVPAFSPARGLSGETTPILSNFKLPTNLSTQFKIRHNEEVLDDDVASTPDSLFKLNHYDATMKLPAWLKSAITSTREIRDEFSRLEKFERRRLNLALSTSSSSITVNPFFSNHGHDVSPSKNKLLSPGGTTTEASPSISFGVDYGHKNRYKDIFLFDHSRVKLNDINKRQQCDYINASYLNPMENLNELVKPSKTKEIASLKQHLTYIATQGPLQATIGDFWKCVINHQVPIIVSLTNEFEDGVTKCSPFWVPGTYKSNDNEINVEIVDVQKFSQPGQDDKTLILRTFRITMDQVIVHEVLQMHLLTWPDMSTALTPKDLVAMVVLKNYIINKILPASSSSKPYYSAIIHCSAGCGRTGTLCTLDSIINVLKFNQDDNMELKFNPVYPMVNNFRKQRISMVQTLRQYYLIYDTLLIYIALYKDKNREDWKQLVESRLVNEFIDRVRKE